MKSPTLEITAPADAPLRIPAVPEGKKIVDAIRRRLRKQGLDLLLQHTRGSLQDLIRLERGAYVLPTTLLSQATATGRKYGIDVRVIDERRSVPGERGLVVPPLGEVDGEAVRRMLRRDCGVLISANTADLMTVAAALVARHRQRTLWLVVGNARQDVVRRYLGEIGGGGAGSGEHVHCGLYSVCAAESLSTYGMVVLDDLADADPASLVTLVAAYSGPWLFGLADRPTRSDGLQEIVYSLVGGVLHDLPVARIGAVVRFVFRARITNFSSPYQGRGDYQNLLAALVAASSRNRVIADDLQAEVTQGRSAIVISDRREHLKKIAFEAGPDFMKRCALVSSDKSPGERAEIVSAFGASQLDALLCTSQVANDALRSRAVDCLFLVFPFSYGTRVLDFLEELGGRATNDKVTIYDYDDILVDPLHRAFDKRAKIIRRVQLAAEQEFANWSQLGLPLPELGT